MRPFVFRRRLPAEFGGAAVTVSPASGLRYLFRPMRSVDPGLLEMAKEFTRRDAVVWDVGANLGLFAFAAAHLAGSGGKVIAVEPDLWLVRLLRLSARRQPASSAPVTVVPCAIAASAGLRTFCIANRSRAANFLAGYGSSQTGGEAERQTVLTMTLDWLREQVPVPDVLKIDTEGAELEVLHGARNLFESARPVVLCEVSSERAAAVTEFLASFGYRLFDGELPAAAREPVKLATWSTIAVPA